MNGWILYRKKYNELNENSDYEILRLLNAASQRNISLKIYTPDEFELVVPQLNAKEVLVNGKPTPLPDFLIPRMGAKTSYFGLAIIRQLEWLGVYSCNSAATIDTVKDKLHMHQLLSTSHLPTPKIMFVKFPINIEVVDNAIGFPIVIKNTQGTEGEGIYLCETQEKFNDLMSFIYTNSRNTNIILQEFAPFSRGKDLRVFLLGGRVIGCMKRTSKTNFKANFSSGGNVQPFDLTQEIQWLATETARLVNLDIAGIDLLFDKSGYKICEANSSPGFKGLERITGKNIAEQILDYIMTKVNGHTKVNTAIS